MTRPLTVEQAIRSSLTERSERLAPGSWLFTDLIDHRWLEYEARDGTFGLTAEGRDPML